jgi:3-dehydroquinate dehydratase II
MTKAIYILNGPNLNLLGKRQPEIYGRQTLVDVETELRKQASEAGLTVDCFQSNHEGELVDRIQQARDKAAAIIINAGAFTHSSIAILDALNAFDGPVIEVHISNIHKRESFRHHSYISLRADGVIVGNQEICLTSICDWSQFASTFGQNYRGIYASYPAFHRQTGRVLVNFHRRFCPG